MQTSNILSVVALGVSAASLAVSSYKAFVDRSRVRAKSILWGNDEDGYSFEVAAVNAGRRSVILTTLRGRYEDGSSMGESLRNDSQGVRLGEDEAFSERIKDEEDSILYHCLPPHSRIVDMWLEDTLGRRYNVRNAKKHLKRFFQSIEPETGAEPEKAPA
jgi:hypothetical protein